MLACPINVSEGRRAWVLDEITRSAGGDAVLDRHSDPHHHRSVFSVVGEEAPRRIANAAVSALDLRRHRGAHPRIGTLDVVPFSPLTGSTMADAVAARDRFVAWIGETLGVPAFAYGGGGRASLPDVRARAFLDLAPDAGPARPHPRAGAVAVGARSALVAYNLWLAEPDVVAARRVAVGLRSPVVRALGFLLGGRAQVSINLLEPLVVGPADAYAIVAGQVAVAGAELVGLVPEAVLASVPEPDWGRLGLSPGATWEARAAAGGMG